MHRQKFRIPSDVVRECDLRETNTIFSKSDTGKTNFHNK